MLYSFSLPAITLSGVVLCLILGAGFLLQRRAYGAPAFFAAHHRASAALNGLALAGSFFSGAMLLGIVGLIAFHGFDGLLLALPLAAGWVPALLIAEPLHARSGLGLGDLLDPTTGRNRMLRIAAAVAAIVISLMLLVAELLAAGAIAPAVLFIPPTAGICFVGLIVVLVAAAAGMHGATWLQAGKTLLLAVVLITAAAVFFQRGLAIKPAGEFPQVLDAAAFSAQISASDSILRSPGPFAERHFVRVAHADGSISTWKFTGIARFQRDYPASTFIRCQVVCTTAAGKTLVDNLPESEGNGLASQGFLQRLPIDPAAPTNVQPRSPALGPLSLLTTLQQSSIAVPSGEQFATAEGVQSVFYPAFISGADFLSPGMDPALSQRLSEDGPARLNFLSLMIALGAAAVTMPHVLLRTAATRTATAARNAAGLATICVAVLFVLLIPMGLFAAVSRQLDATSPMLSLPLLANAIGPVAFGCMAAVALAAIIATACGQVAVISGAFAHDLLPLRSRRLDHRMAVGAGKLAAVVGGVMGILLAVGFSGADPLFFLSGGCDVAAAALLPAIVARLCLRGVSGQAMAVSIFTGGISTLVWLALSPDGCAVLYGLPAARSPLPFTHPTLFTVPLAAAALIISLPRERRTA